MGTLVLVVMVVLHTAVGLMEPVAEVAEVVDTTMWHPLLRKTEAVLVYTVKVLLVLAGRHVLQGVMEVAESAVYMGAEARLWPPVVLVHKAPSASSGLEIFANFHLPAQPTNKE